MAKKIYLKDSKIRTHVSTEEYRDGWARIFGHDKSDEVPDESEGAGGDSEGAKGGKGGSLRDQG